MILEIRHETRFEYTEPVTEAICEMRMEPRSDEGQSCHSFHLALRPTAERFRYQDGFDNVVHHFNVLAPHAEVRLRAASVVLTHRERPAIERSAARLPIDPATLELEPLQFLALGGPVREGANIEPVLAPVRGAEGTRVIDAALATARHIHEKFEYAPQVTHASSPIDHVLEEGKGVCQDFAHLMLAMLRTQGIPARYVSGYLHRPGRESQSHAWVDVWVPDLGWVGIDPTNDCLVDGNFVSVALGRNFNDVPPNKGVYRGTSGEAIFVRVETKELSALPPLSWQEQLPSLQAPLAAIASRPRWAGGKTEMEQQQQQQQQ